MWFMKLKIMFKIWRVQVWIDIVIFYLIIEEEIWYWKNKILTENSDKNFIRKFLSEKIENYHYLLIPL